ncbi:hypothetical protein EW146_g6431 [Bondarzewia mesenterica]|uniref:Uncharacterized protein n=1 Tax=Bondarzewia mesenterica TaxID=1095465 RepID=A0A4S4LQF9_9AGAM|nr:hypothetical protein EW146_g6431 [Bondarzewia mesenterica]
MSSPRNNPNRARSPNRGGVARGRGQGRGRGGRNPPAVSSLTTRPLSPAPRPPLDRAPGGICNFYWSTGSCNRGFECTFRHQAKPSVEEVALHSISVDQAPDFFSTEGLALNNGSVQSEQHNLKPSEAHNHLKPFLRDNFCFDGPSRVEGFVRIFASINGHNKYWNFDSAQSFLDTIVHGNALYRIGDVLRWDIVSVNAGVGSTNLSFQRAYFPVFQYLASDLVLKSTLHHNINALYGLIDHNYDKIHKTLSDCIGSMVRATTWKDCSPGLSAVRQGALDGVIVFKSLATIFSQYLNRFKNAIRNHPQILRLFEDLASWFELWAKSVSSTVPTFTDPITSSPKNIQKLTIEQLCEDIVRLVTIARRESGIADNLRRPVVRSVMTAEHRQQAMITRLRQTYDPPGILRESMQPRHDNDFSDIASIRIAPTHQELLCPVEPYLPKYLPDAPHHLPPGSMEKHVDIQFRLLREDLIEPIRQSLSVLHMDLDNIWTQLRHKRDPTKLEKLVAGKGGVYRTSGFDSVFFHLYTGIQFTPAKAERRNFTIGLLVDAPPGAPRDSSAKKRAEYWEHSKRLQSGSLVAFVLVSPGRSRIFLGTITSTSTDIAESAKASADKVQLHVSFFDAEVELYALRREKISGDGSNFAVLVDNNIMLESVRPFLETLQTVEQRGARIEDLDALNPNSIARARQELLHHSNLDPSQVDAVVDTLTREVSLIQGPPGTGKSFIGKEIIRILIASRIKPIVLIAFTNHALDHMLLSVLDSKITPNIIRLGSRTTDERIAEYNLGKLEKLEGKTSLDRSMRREFANMKEVENEMDDVVQSIQLPRLSSEKVEQFLDIHYPEYSESLTSPPYWISRLMEQIQMDEIANGEWTVASGNKKRKDDLDSELRNAAEERGGRSKSGKAMQEDMVHEQAVGTGGVDPRTVFFSALGFNGHIPPVPSSCRATEHLLRDSTSVWSMSFDERTRLAASWEDEIRRMAYESNVSEFELLRERYKAACKRYNDVRDQIIAPKVLMVEEAGQVLESHIIASLVPSVEHIICIGDPQQLRPTLSTFCPSVNGQPRWKGIVQVRSVAYGETCRQRPSHVSDYSTAKDAAQHFPFHQNNFLYKNLEDHENVRQYPPVQGMQKNVFFFTHTHQENGEEDSVSKFNKFEVEMIRDLALYFLKQGPYSGAGDIAVLCAYLGQLQKVRSAFRDIKMAVSVDERDEEQLAKQGDEDVEAGFQDVDVAKHIRLGTVDTFQGEEAKIVIVSLVRNSGSFEGNSSSIGFLKSSNRINVALSRAKHGLFILGNASNLRQNETWGKILVEMEQREQIGHGFPIVCPRHPDQKQVITSPQQLSMVAPQGGCLHPCDFRLSCGHTCQSVSAGVQCLVAQGHAVRSVSNASGSRDLLFLRYHPTASFRVAITRVILASVSFTVNISAASHAPRIMSVILGVVENAARCAPTTNVRNHAGSLAHHVWSLVNGFVLINHVPFCAVQSARVSLAMNHVLMCCPAVILALPFAGSLAKIKPVSSAYQIDLSSTDSSERLITLACGHIFTVETLDGHCQMTYYYDIDHMGRFTGTKAPPINYQSPPSCPTCRGPISALRYGRVTKRANLDILEQNVASTMSQSLEEIGPVVEVLRSELPTMEAAAKGMEYKDGYSPETELDEMMERRNGQYGGQDEPLPPRLFAMWKMVSTHGFVKEEATAWNAIVKGLIGAYKKVASVATTRGPHIRAYEAALSTLYRLEIAAITGDPSRDCDAPEPLAMDEVNKKIGQPPHKADTRFQVEAFFLSLELRFMLAQIARSRIRGLTIMSSDEGIRHHRRLWHAFTEFIFTSCLQDSRKALTIAEKSSASRLSARSAIYIIRAELEKFRFDIITERDDLAKTGRLNGAERKQLAARVNDKRAHAAEFLNKVETAYMRSRPSRTVKDLQVERAWFADECRAKAENYGREYGQLEQHIATDNAYQPLSLQEKADIVKAFKFTHRGHFYNCENGHTFVIGECGGAMQEARCPECRAPIGGSGHRLVSSNTRASEFEEIAHSRIDLSISIVHLCSVMFLTPPDARITVIRPFFIVRTELMSPISGKGKESGTARILGSGTSGYAAGYKVSQRIYKFGGQPWFNDILNRHYKESFTNIFGERKGKSIMQATAGSLTGIGEVILLPLDALKIKRQVNPEAFRGRGFIKIFLEEGTTLYRGWGWTMARNAPGSFALFGASSVTKDYILGVSDFSKATWAQNFVASIAGAVASITVAAPLDVIKTRIQNANFENKTSGMTVMKELLKHEGAGALFKGLTPKILVVGPKLVFSYTIAQSLIPWFAKYV